MNKLLLLLGFTGLTMVGFSQKKDGTYNWGIGFKYQPTAISIKRYTKQGDAAELLLTKYNEGYRATLLLELCPALDFPKHSLRVVLGPGFHGGYRKDQYLERHDNNYVFGFDGVMGLEWKIPKIPIALQVDYQPSIDVIGNDKVYKDWGGATLRIAF